MTELLSVEKGLREEVRGKNEEVREGQSDVYVRAFDFACRILRMDATLAKKRTVNRNAMNQLIRSASSVGANLEEAKAGQSKADFHVKIRIALKEARESYYWLRLLAASSPDQASRFTLLIKEANEIVAILTTIAKRANPKQPPS